MENQITIESSLIDLNTAKNNVKYLLDNADALIDMHDIVYWAGRVEQLRQLIKNSL